MGWEDAAVGADQDAAPAAGPPQPQTPEESQPVGGNPTPTASPAQAGPSPASSPAPDGVSFPATNPPAQPPVVTSSKPGGIKGLIQSLGEALTGKTRPEIGTDQYGNQYVKQVTPTGGQRWAKIAAQAAVGAARGFAAGKGGNPGAAVAAGVDQGAKFAQQRQDQQKDMSMEARQQNLDRANNQILTQKIAEQAMAMKRLQVQGTREAIDFSEKQQDWLAQHSEGGEPIGYLSEDGTPTSSVGNLKDLAQVMIQNPGFHEGHIQDARMQPAQLWDKDGIANGFAVYKLKQGSNDDMMPAGTTVYQYDAVNDKMVPHQTSQPMKGGDVFATNNSAAAAMNEAHLKSAQLEKAKNDVKAAAEEGPLKAAQAQEAKGKAAEAFAAAHKTNTESVANGGDPTLTHSTIVKGMLDGSVDITKAVGIFKDPHAREQYIAEAKQQDPSWSMQKYQDMMNMRTDLTKGKLGDQVMSFNTFLGHASSVSDDVNKLRNTDSKLLNHSINWLRANATDNEIVASMLPEIDATRGEFQNFISNHALQKSEIERGEKLLSEDQSPAAMQAAIKDFMKVAVTRLGSVHSRVAKVFGDQTPQLIDSQNIQHLRDLGMDRYANNYGLMPHNAGPTAAPSGPPAIAPGTPPPAAGMKRVWAPGMPTWKDVPAAAVKANVPGQVVQ